MTVGILTCETCDKSDTSCTLVPAPHAGDGGARGACCCRRAAAPSCPGCKPWAVGGGAGGASEEAVAAAAAAAKPARRCTLPPTAALEAHARSCCLPHMSRAQTGLRRRWRRWRRLLPTCGPAAEAAAVVATEQVCRCLKPPPPPPLRQHGRVGYDGAKGACCCLTLMSCSGHKSWAGSCGVGGGASGCVPVPAGDVSRISPEFDWNF